MTDPAYFGIIDLENFTAAEKTKLRIIHRRVLGYKLREANKQRLEKMEETIQENIVLRRLLLSLRNSTEPNKENQSLLKQIDEQLKIRVLPK